MSYIYFNESGLVLVPDGPFHADILFDYLKTTAYKWKCNQYRTHFLIEDFEYSGEELKEKLTYELESQSISSDFFVNEN